MNNVIAQVSGSTTTSGDLGAVSPVWSVLWLVFMVAMLVAMWRVFQKAGRPGWACLIPFYNQVVLLRITGRSGWLLLGIMFVPFWNMFLIIRMIFELARVFGRGVGFGFGLLFLFPIFAMILAFGDAEYVGPHAGRPAPFPAGGLAHAPTAP